MPVMLRQLKAESWAPLNGELVERKGMLRVLDVRKVLFHADEIFIEHHR